MSNEKERRDLITKWVTDVKHAAGYAAKLLLLDKKLQAESITEEERKCKLVEAFIENWRNWANQLPDDTLIDEGISLWCYVTAKLGIGELIWPRVLTYSINSDYSTWLEHINQLKAQHAVPANIEPKDYAALLLSLYSLKLDGQHLPPGHRVWQSLGVKSASEYKAQNPLTEILKLSKPDNFNWVMRAIIAYAKRAFESQGTSDKMEYVSEYTGLESNIADNISDLECRDERLRLIGQLKSRELDILNAELERLHADKTREQWYGADKARKVTQQIKYLKAKYSKH